jgi:CRP/FNR family transcriptional regulator, cyclic AMP receptor protein
MIQNSRTLGRIPLFRTLAPEAVRRLDTQCTWRRAKAAECVVDYKNRDTSLYFVTQGHVRVLIRAGSGKELILRDIRDGEYFGELAAIDGLPRSATIVAVTNAVVAAMPPTVFRGLVHEHSDVCDQLLVLLASQIRVLANRVNEQGTLDVRARIHAELLRLCRPAQDGDTRAVISPPPTQVELAARVSTRREAISRELKSLERAGLLERRRGAIVLLDTAQLARMIEEAGQ